MQHVMGIAVQGGGEASESSGSDYGSTLFSHDSHSKGSQYSGFTTPGSTEDANRKIQAAQALAEKNVELMSEDHSFLLLCFFANLREH